MAARLLARSGWRVTVLNEGIVSPSVDEGWIPAPLLRDCAVEVTVSQPDPWASVLLADGGRLELWNDMARSVEAIGRLSPGDAARWPEFCRRMAALARVFEALYVEPPVDLLNLGLAVKVRRLGREGMEDLMRVLPMSAAELLDDWFECDALKGVLGALAIRHLQQGPRSGGTAFRLLHHHVGSAPGVFRPPRSNLSAALRDGAALEIRAAALARIHVRGGRATGVVLASGEEVPGDVVVSALDARRTLVELADPGWLDPQLARAVTHIRRRGVVARVLFKTPHPAHAVLAPSLNYLERAYDAAKYGEVSAQPYLEAQPGEGGTAVHFQFAPYRRADGDWNAARRAELAELTRRCLSPHLPEIAEASASVLAPTDLEAREGWPDGQAYHAELTLDQALWMRPLPELAQYRTPIDGLWLCGPGTHPGGGIAGAAGYNCARAFLAQLPKR